MMVRKKLLLPFIILLIAGCAGPNIENYYTAPRFTSYYVKDVGFLGITSREDLPPDVVSRVEETFLRELRKRNWYRVQRITEGDLNDFDKMKTIDTVLWGEILYYKNNEPFRFGLSTKMRFINTDQIIWSAYYIFDAANQKTIDLLENYYQQRLYPHSPLWGYKLYLLNMDKFVEFSCNSILDTIQLGLEEKEEEERPAESETQNGGSSGDEK
ncbi:MAG: hypothetical protein JXD21_02115 [Candidatus Omnitrophica bacterium]|nr:hypothetical protein [Candidatus Omnitrophota bacterium]